jgi:putative transcriptional regulator
MATKKSRNRNRKETAVEIPPPPMPLGTRMIASLQEVVDAIKAGEVIEKRFTVRTAATVPEPGRYDAREVKLLRASLAMSQAVFAQIMGVSVDLVQSWEHGTRKPAPIARRLLDEVGRNRTYWLRTVLGKTA